MKIGTMLKNKQNGEVVKVDIVGTDGNIAVKSSDGKRKSISVATIKRWYEEVGEQESAAKLIEKPIEKKEVSKPSKQENKVSVPAEKVIKKEKENPINVGSVYLEKISKDVPFLTTKKKVYYTGLYKGSKIVCLLFPRLKKIIFGFSEKTLAENFNGAAYNKKGHFRTLPESCNSIYNQQITVKDDESYANAMEYVKVIAKAK